MIYSVFRTKLKDTLNRRDATDARLDIFVDDAFQRINRTLDHHIREGIHTYTVLATDGESVVTLPADAGKKLVEVYVNDIPAEASPDRTGLQTYYLGYTRRANTLVFNYALPEDTTVRVVYWRDFTRPGDGVTNDILARMNSLILYGALVEAGTFFQHSRLAEWQANFDRVLAEASAEYTDREMSGYGGPMVLNTPYGQGVEY